MAACLTRSHVKNKPGGNRDSFLRPFERDRRSGGVVQPQVEDVHAAVAERGVERPVGVVAGHGEVEPRFDHRVADGAQVGAFLGELRGLVESPELALLDL